MITYAKNPNFERGEREFDVAMQLLQLNERACCVNKFEGVSASFSVTREALSARSFVPVSADFFLLFDSYLEFLFICNFLSCFLGIILFFHE